MPLSSPAERALIQTRQITCQGFRRNDGLWDIEGTLLDVRAYDFARRDGTGVHPAGAPVHDMQVRFTIDSQFVLHAVEVATPHTPFASCPDIAPRFADLCGLCLTNGFVKALRTRYGGVRGCTHLVDLMTAMATAAFQTLYPLLSRQNPEPGRPVLIDSCHALSADGPVVAKAWPEYALTRLAPQNDTE